MLKIGLTGGIGSGKTTVSDLFKNLQVAVIDTDVIAHDLVNKNSAVLSEIAEIFGESVINADGELNRQQLAKIVFNNKTKKQQLEDILHPKIREHVKRQINALQENPHQASYCIVVIPLLFETEFDDLIDRVLVVVADKQTRIQRITERDNRSLDEIHSIISTQVSDETRIAKADDVLSNNSDISSLESQVIQLDKIYRELSAPA